MIDNTGERILLEHESALMIARHFCAYKFAQTFCNRDTRVLDIGCGEGYGIHYLAEFAKTATGIDYSTEAIEYAAKKYQRGNLEFIVHDMRALRLLNKRFDLICSFQVIEHLKEAVEFLGGIQSLLEERAVFLCSTPNKFDASPHSEVPCNKFHLKEYEAGEFRELLGRYFSSVDMFGLKRSKKFNFYRRIKKIGLCNFFSDSINPVKRFYQRMDCSSFVLSKDNLDTALDFIAVCRI